MLAKPADKTDLNLHFGSSKPYSKLLSMLLLKSFEIIQSIQKYTTFVHSKPFPQSFPSFDPPPGPSLLGRSSFGCGWGNVAKSTEGPKILAPMGSGCRNHMGHGGSLPLLSSDVGLLFGNTVPLKCLYIYRHIIHRYS